MIFILVVTYVCIVRLHSVITFVYSSYYLRHNLRDYECIFLKYPSGVPLCYRLPPAPERVLCTPARVSLCSRTYHSYHGRITTALIPVPGAEPRLSNSVLFITQILFMYVSAVSAQACQCFTVIFTDLKDWKRVALPHFMSFEDASIKSREYQSLMDPKRKSFDFRVHMCS